MTAVQSFCHRAMLIDDGAITYIGDPEETGRRYLRTNFARRRISIEGDREVEVVADLLARVSDSWLENDRGERIPNVEVGEPIRLHAVIEARRRLSSPAFGLQVNNADGVQVFGLSGTLAGDGKTEVIEKGQEARITSTIENPLLPGRYSVIGWVAVTRNKEETAQQAMKLLEFVVFGTATGQGIVSVPGELEVEVDVEAAPAPEARG